MLNRVLLVVLLIFIWGVIFLTGGCSLMGLGIGTLIDSSRPDSTSLPGWQVDNLKPDKNIKITFLDGEQLKATYKGIELFPPNEYARRYNESLEINQPDVILPPLDDTIGITQKSGESIEREFLGFDYRYQPAETRGAKESSPFTPVLVSVKAKENAVPQNLSSAKFIKVSDSKGNVLEGDVLDKLAMEGKIPFLSAISLETSDSMMLIPREKIFQIERKNSKNAKWIGLGIGGVFDVTAILLLVAILPTIDLLGSGPM
jgi:hypothetical protein